MSWVQFPLSAFYYLDFILEFMAASVLYFAFIMLWQCLPIQLPAIGAPNVETDFIIKPYLQLGNHPLQSRQEKLELLWVSTSNRDDWKLEVKEENNTQWQQQKPPSVVILSYSVPDRLISF